MYCRKCGAITSGNNLLCDKCATLVTGSDHMSDARIPLRKDIDNKPVNKTTHLKLWLGVIIVVLLGICSVIAILIVSKPKEAEHSGYFIRQENKTASDSENTVTAQISNDVPATESLSAPESETVGAITQDDAATEYSASEDLHTYEALNDVAVNVQNVQSYIDIIDGMHYMTDSGNYDGVGANNFRRTYYTNGSFSDELIKTVVSTGATELDKLMKHYGYSNYTLTYYYDNYDYYNDVISYGPNLIVATIDGRSFKYYFYMNNMIRRVAPDASTDLPKTNDFLKELYRMGYEYRYTFNTMNQTSAPGTAEAYPADTVSAEPCLYSVTVTAYDGFVNFRTGPSMDYSIITPIYNGTILNVYEENETGKWLRVEYNSQSGWVAASQVTVR